jgi:hypothetical protein
MRWGIETLFSPLKWCGHQFKETHMTKGGRIGRLTGVLVVAFALNYQWGHKLERGSGLQLEPNGHRAKSISRQGFENLHLMPRLPVNPADRPADFLDHIAR